MKDTKFKKGCTPWNKGKVGKRPKGLKYQKHKDNPTSFKKGNKPWNMGKKYHHKNPKKSKGFISHGYSMFSIMGRDVFEHHLIWMEANQLHRIPSGCMIHHLDGNKLNNSIGNLQLMTKDFHTKIHKTK